MRSSSQGLWCPDLRLDLDESDKRTFVLKADVNEENGLFPMASEGLLAAGGKRLSTVDGYSVCPTAADDSMVAAGKARFPYSLFGWPPSSFLCVVLRCTVGCVEVKRAAVFVHSFLVSLHGVANSSELRFPLFNRSSSLLAANASVTRKCRSSQVFSQQDPRNTFPEHYKVRRSHQQEIVRRMSCCQAARICSKGHVSA